MGPQMGAWLVLVGYVGRPGLQCWGGGGGDVAARPRSEAATADVCRVGRCFPPPPVRCGAPSAAGQVGPSPAPPGHVVATWLVSCWRATSWWWWTGLVSRSGEPGKPSGAGSSSHRRRRRAGPMRGDARRRGRPPLAGGGTELVAGLPPAAAGVEHPSLGRRRYR